MENLTQKEKLLLEDQKKHEQLCIKKYTDYANQASDSQLKQLFHTNAQQEKQHLDTINQILQGQMPNTSSQQGNQSGMQQKQSNVTSGPYHENDANLCSDLLMTEKFVSGNYDTTIFEFRDSNIRQTLNHIQKEEQQHGENIYNYMASHNMY